MNREPLVGYYCYKCHTIWDIADLCYTKCPKCHDRVFMVSDKMNTTPPVSVTRKKKLKEIFKNGN